MKELQRTILAGLALALLAAAPLAWGHECPKYYDPEPTSPPGQDEVPRKGSMPFAHGEVGAAVRPGLTNVMGIHYWTDLENARKRFIEAGFQGIRELRYAELLSSYQRGGYNRGDCNALRQWVRAEDRAGRGTSWYSGDRDWSDTPCSVYLFRADAYIGPQGDLGRAWE